MKRRSPVLLLALLAWSLAAPPAAAQVHKDERLGFKLKVPRGWEAVPLQAGEQWVAAQYFCDKPDFVTIKSLGYTLEHTAALKVIAFVDQFIDGELAPQEEGEEKESEPQSVSASIRLGKVYRNYKEFLKDHISGGYFISAEETDTEGDLPVTRMEIRAESSYGNGHRLFQTWIYETEIGSIAVEFEVLEDAYKKKRKAMDKVFRSFEPIPRTQPLELGRQGSEFLSYLDLARLTPAERADRRKAAESAQWSRVTGELMDGWNAYEFDAARIITRHDERHAKEVAESIAAVMDWLDETFPTIGQDEYVRRPLVRICQDLDEERRFRSGSGFGIGRMEIVTHKDSGGATGYEWEWINARAMDIWFYERDSSISLALPPWLRFGLEQVVESAKLKGRRLKFYRDDWEMAWLDDLEPWGLERVMTMGLAEFMEGSRETARPLGQAVTLARLLVDGAGSRGAYDGLLNDYLLNYRAILAEMDAEDDKKGERPKKATSEAEEAAQLKARRERIRQREAKLLREAYDRTMGKLSEKALANLKKAYLKEVR